MTNFEWVLIALVFLGLIVPFWLVLPTVYSVSKRRRDQESSARYFAYIKLLDELKIGKGDFVIDNGAIYAATLRELKSYQEYADITVLLLEEINITGSGKFDQIMKIELQATESHLLGQNS